MPESDTRSYYLWLAVTIGLTLAPYTLLLWSLVDHLPYLVQDDARHLVVWLRRLSDSGLYPNDIMASHFDTLTPWLYAALFRPFALAGIDPVLAHLWVVTPLSGAAFAAASYVFFHWFWPSSMGSAVAALAMFGLFEWRYGLAHDFGFTLAMVLMLLFWMRRAVAAALAMVVATGLLPVVGLTSGVTMMFLMWSRRRPFLTRDRRAWSTIIAAGIGCTLGGAIAISAAGTSGPTYTVAEARSIPIFGPEGRNRYFAQTLASTHLCSEKTGIVPLCEGGSDGQIVSWSLVVAALFAAGLWAVASGRARTWLTHWGIPSMDERLARTWAAFVGSALVLVPIAHAVAFQLHMPERFARYTLKLGFGMMVSLSTAVLVVAVVRGIAVATKTARLGYWVVILPLVVLFVWAGHAKLSGSANLVFPVAPEIHDFLRSTPKDTVVAGVVEEIDSVPAFGQRSVLASLQLLVPYKKLFFLDMERRMVGLATSLYAPSSTAFARLKTEYRIDYILVARTGRDELYDLQLWATNFPGHRSHPSLARERTGALLPYTPRGLRTSRQRLPGARGRRMCACGSVSRLPGRALDV